MGVAQHEQDRLDPRYLRAVNAANKIDSRRRSEMEDDWLYQKFSKPGTQIKAGLSKSGAMMLSNTSQKGSFMGTMGDTIGGAATLVTLPGSSSQAKNDIADVKKQEAYLKSMKSTNGQLGNTLSVGGNIAQKYLKTTAGLYGAGYLGTAASSMANMAGYSKLGGMLGTGGSALQGAGKFLGSNNLLTPTGWNSLATQSLRSTLHPGLGSAAHPAMANGMWGAAVDAGKQNATSPQGLSNLAPYLLNKGSAAMGYMGNMATSAGLSGTGHAMSASASGLSTLADSLAKVDPMIGTTAGLLAMMGGGILSNKFIQKMKAQNPAQKLMKTGKNIITNIRSASQLKEQYSDTRVLDNQLNMYNAMGALSAGETLMISYLSSISGNTGLLQFMAEHQQIVSEGSRTGSSMAHNSVASKYSNTVRDDELSMGHSTDATWGMDGMGKLGYRLNQGLVGLNKTVTGLATIVNPLGYLSSKNSPVALLKELFETNSESKAMGETAERLNIPSSFMVAMETTATKAMDASTPELQMVGLLAWIGENVRHLTHMAKTREIGENTIGMVAGRKDELEDEKNSSWRNMESALGKIPILNMLGVGMMGLRAGKNALSKTWDAGRAVGGAIINRINPPDEDPDAPPDGTRDPPVATNPEYLMWTYLGTVYPEKFEKLLGAQELLGAQIERLIESTTNNNGCCDEEDPSLTTPPTSGNRRILSVLQLLLREERKRTRREELIHAATLTDDHAQEVQRIAREHDEAILRNKAIHTSVLNMEIILKKILNKMTGAGSDDDIPPPDEGGGGLLAGLAALLWGKLKSFGTGMWNITKAAGTALVTAAPGIMTKGRAMFVWAYQAASKLAKFWKPFALVSGAIGLYLYWDEIKAGIKEKFKNLADGDFQKFFGFGDSKDTDPNAKPKTGFESSKDIAKTLFGITSTAALMFPSPITLGLAAAVGLYAYQDDILGGVKSGFGSLDKLMGGALTKYFGVDEPKVQQADTAQYGALEVKTPVMTDASLKVRSDRQNAMTSLFKTNATTHIIPELINQNLGDAKSFFDEEYLKENKYKKSMTAMDLLNGNKNLNDKGQKISDTMATLNSKYGGDNNVIDTKEEMKKMMDESKKDRELYAGMSSEQTNILINALSTLINVNKQSIGSTIVAEEKKKWADVLVLNTQQVTSTH